MKKVAKKRKWTAGEMERRLRVKFAHPKYALITGVANATGWSAGRWCDAISMGLWPSSGLYMEGYEIKVARGDWLRELQDVSKSEAFAKYLDFWWIVAPPGIVKLEELPARWGLMETSGPGLRIRRPATKRDNKQDIPTGFLAALLRYATRQSPAEEVIKAERKQAFDQGMEQGKSSIKRDYQMAKRRAEELEKAIADFREASGVEIDRWSGGRVGDAVKAVLAGRVSAVKRHLENVSRWASGLAESAQASLEALDGENGGK